MKEEGERLCLFFSLCYNLVWNARILHSWRQNKFGTVLERCVWNCWSKGRGKGTLFIHIYIYFIKRYYPLPDWGEKQKLEIKTTGWVVGDDSIYIFKRKQGRLVILFGNMVDANLAEQWQRGGTFLVFKSLWGMMVFLANGLCGLVSATMFARMHKESPSCLELMPDSCPWERTLQQIIECKCCGDNLNCKIIWR